MDISTSSKPTPPTAKEERLEATPEQATPQRPHSPRSYFDYGDDLVERVRAARAEAQRQMEEFGDVSEYEIRIIQGQKKESSDAAASVNDTNTGETQS
jgi:hypothetical protein